MTDKDFDERKLPGEPDSSDKYTFIYFKNLNYVEMVLKPSRLVINRLACTRQSALGRNDQTFDR